MEKKTVKCGIIGSGFAASFHFEALLRVYTVAVEVVGVFSVDTAGAEAFAAKHGIKVVDSLEELIAASDVVHICTPPNTHEEIAVQALKWDTYAIVEKPLTGYFGDGSEDFNGKTSSKETALNEALASIKRMLEAEKNSKGKILYAENWVYAPAIQKECELIMKSGAQVLRMYGEESHSGSHAHTYGFWKFNGGGSIMGKACHPLSAALYFKRVEGMARNGQPIRPKSVTCRAHTLTQIEGFEDKGHLRSDYHDVEDYGIMHIIFEDGTVADIVASEITLGGVHNWIEVFANNHRTICNINPNTSMQSYTPKPEYFDDVYIVEKTETKAGWSNPSPDEGWYTGYQHELEAFYRTVAFGEKIESNSGLAADCISVIYSAYLSAEKSGAEVTVKTL